MGTKVIPMREFVCKYCHGTFERQAWASFVCDKAECRKRQAYEQNQTREASRKERKKQIDVVKNGDFASPYPSKRKPYKKNTVQPHYTNWGIVWVGLPETKCPECQRLKGLIMDAMLCERYSFVPALMVKRYQHQHAVHGIPYIPNDKSTAERRAEAGAQQPSLV